MKHYHKIESKKVQLSIIGLIAALMGIGQNGLLVSLPFLVTHSAFSLPTWSIIIAIGSFLFLPAAPFWGRYSDKNGPKGVVYQALSGMSLSFLLLLFCQPRKQHHSKNAKQQLHPLLYLSVH
ncbi:MFS transporter [Moritella sp.]|uniref:MFS transporter n=1 Tax=Moritella sp. TaxID=78556 RepID=UPI0025E7D8EF|nr:MFS transporter [Moritella sp.]